jgi:proton glutamate symport protein
VQTVPQSPKRAKGSVIWSTVGLVAGLVLGITSHSTKIPVIEALAPWIGAAGDLWVNILTGLVLPLTVSALVTAVTSQRDSGRTGRMGATAIALFVGLMLVCSLFTLALAPPMIQWFPRDAAVGEALKQKAPPETPVAASKLKDVSGPADVVNTLTSKNLLKSATAGDLLPVLLIAVLFGAAVNLTSDPGRGLLVSFFQAIYSALMVVVGWLFRFLPIGAFCLSFTFSHQAGLGVAGILGQFALISCLLMAAFTLALYPLTCLLGRISPMRFIEGVAPAQIVALTSRSSLASLPALLAGVEKAGLDRSVAEFSLPLAVSVFKLNRGVSTLAKGLFVAYLCGLTITPGQLVVFIATYTLVSFTSAGIPGGGGPGRNSIPYLTIGLPLQAVLILEAVDPLVDIMKTVINVTSDFSAAVFMNRIFGQQTVEVAAPEQMAAAEAE